MPQPRQRIPRMKRPRPERGPVVRWLAAGFCALVLLALTRVPYETLREERIRAFGEEPALGVVTARRTVPAQEGERHELTYRYRGPDGVARLRSAPFPADVWHASAPGTTLEVYFASGEPNLSRARFEVEDGFRVWLREAVRGDALPERAREKGRETP
jgi:hypothetical protein